jgi:hypothetical protein
MLGDAIDDMPATFLWNMDEIGHSDSADAHQEAVYVPSDIAAGHVPLPVSRAEKRITLVGGDWLDGSLMKPMVVISRHTVDKDLPLLGVSEWNSHICHQSSGLIDRELFERWFREIFLNELKAKRAATRYCGPAILILDGCTAHDGDYFWDTCLRKNVIAIPIPAHDSNQGQPCDVGLFGLTKQLITRLNKPEDENIQSLHITKLVSAYYSACNDVNVITSVRNAGISARLHANGRPVGFADVDQCRCPIHSLTMSESAEFEGAAHAMPELDELAESPDLASLRLWLQLLEEEAARLSQWAMAK